MSSLGEELNSVPRYVFTNTIGNMASFDVAMQSQRFGTPDDTSNSSVLKMPKSTNVPNVKPLTYAGATSSDPKKHKSNFCRLECSKKTNDVDLSVPMKVVEDVNFRFESTLNGYFLGKRIAFSVVYYYLRNAWAKYGIKKVMMNTKGVLFL